MKYAAILLCLLATSCMNQRKAAKKIQKMLSEYPEMRDTVRLTVHDTVYIPGDTVWRQVLLRKTDTVKVETDRQSVRIVRVPTGSPCDTAEFRAEVLATVKPDTVVVTNTVEVPRFAPCPPEGVADWWRVVAIVLAILLAILLLAAFLINRYTPRP